MAKDALGKLADAKAMRRIAKEMQLSNAPAARKLRDLAAKKENAAVKQFQTRPRKKSVRR